jgi:hypothetical protein
VAAFVVVLVVVGGALALLGHGGHPASSPPPSPPAGGGYGAIVAKTPQRQLRREMGYISAATRPVLKSPACRLEQPTGVTFIHGSPDPQLLSVLGVLRRPARPFDRIDQTLLSGMPDNVYAGHLRRAFSAGGTSYYIVPARPNRAAEVPSTRCFDLQAAALADYLPKIPVALRKPTKALEAALIAYAHQLAAHASGDMFCLVTVGGNGTGASCGMTAAELKQGVPPENDGGTFVGVVPDSVASVTLHFRAAGGQPAKSISATVKDNVYVARTGEARTRPLQPTSIIWRSAQGHVIKTISAPTPAQAAAACRTHPLACLAVQSTTAVSGSAGPIRAAPARGH